MRRDHFLLATLTLFCFCLHHHGLAQYQFGVSLGFAPANTQIANNHVIVNGQLSDFTFNTERAGSEVYAGAFARRYLDDGFFVQTELLYRSQTMDYLIHYLDLPVDNEVYSEQMHEIAIPISFGVQFNNGMEVSSGLTTRFIIDHQTGLTEVPTFRTELPIASLSLHTAVGFNLESVRFSLTYLLDFNNYGSHLYLYEEQLQLSNAAGRLIATAAYAF